jgi:hypothetical protein
MASRKRAASTPLNDERTPPTAAKTISDRVVLNVGGTNFTCSASTLSASSEFFAGRLNGLWNRDDEIFLDRDAAPFAVMLTYMRSGLVELPEGDKSMWRRAIREADYYGVVGFLYEIKARTYRNEVKPDWSGTDEEAVAAFDERHGSIEAALLSGVLPCRFYARAAGYFDERPSAAVGAGEELRWISSPWQPDETRVLQVMPADGYVVEIASGPFGWSTHTRDVQALALVQRANSGCLH